MDARSADEGRNFFSAPGGKNRQGEQLLPENVSIVSDPTATSAPGLPWEGEGQAQRRREWVQKGRVSTLACDRFWAEKTGREAIPGPSNILMSGGQGSLADLIASTERGVLITSFWYIRMVDPRTLLLTGLTRDGVFWIEGGKLAYPIKNFRWNNSPVQVLKNIDAMSAAVRVSPRADGFAGMSVPALRVKDFELSSASDAV
jgi:predicted Zn-dependent protease